MASFICEYFLNTSELLIAQSSKRLRPMSQEETPQSSKIDRRAEGRALGILAR
jgi:hypothetical protein